MKVYKYGANVDTDVIIPARHLNDPSPAALASHCMEDIDKTFIKRVKAGDIFASAHRKLPPGLLHVVLELAPEGTVVPEPRHAPVDLGGVVNEPAALAQRAQRIQR